MMHKLHLSVWFCSVSPYSSHALAMQGAQQQQQQTPAEPELQRKNMLEDIFIAMEELGKRWFVLQLAKEEMSKSGYPMKKS